MLTRSASKKEKKTINDPISSLVAKFKREISQESFNSQEIKTPKKKKKVVDDYDDDLPELDYNSNPLVSSNLPSCSFINDDDDDDDDDDVESNEESFKESFNTKSSRENLSPSKNEKKKDMPELFFLLILQRLLWLRVSI
jgi:hypothetical protein